MNQRTRLPWHIHQHLKIKIPNEIVYLSSQVILLNGYTYTMFTIRGQDQTTLTNTFIRAYAIRTDTALAYVQISVAFVCINTLSSI